MIFCWYAWKFNIHTIPYLILTAVINIKIRISQLENQSIDNKSKANIKNIIYTFKFNLLDPVTYELCSW
jgi:hypothetical protein